MPAHRVFQLLLVSNTYVSCFLCCNCFEPSGLYQICYQHIDIFIQVQFNEDVIHFLLTRGSNLLTWDAILLYVSVYFITVVFIINKRIEDLC